MDPTTGELCALLLQVPDAADLIVVANSLSLNLIQALLQVGDDKRVQTLRALGEHYAHFVLHRVACFPEREKIWTGLTNHPEMCLCYHAAAQRRAPCQGVQQQLQTIQAQYRELQLQVQTLSTQAKASYTSSAALGAELIEESHVLPFSRWGLPVPVSISISPGFYQQWEEARTEEQLQVSSRSRATGSRRP